MITKDEFSKLLVMATDPDKAPEALQQLQEHGEEIFSDVENFTKQLEEHKAKVAELRDTNMRMFLKVGAKGEEIRAEEKEETGDEKFDRLFTQEAMKDLGIAKE